MDKNIEIRNGIKFLINDHKQTDLIASTVIGKHWHYLIFTSLCVAVKSELWAAGSAIRCLSPTSD
jgi:hypothetical protein